MGNGKWKNILTSSGYLETSSSPTGTVSMPSKSLPMPTLWENLIQEKKRMVRESSADVLLSPSHVSYMVHMICNCRNSRISIRRDE